MAISAITIGANTYTLCAMPPSGFLDAQLGINDVVAVNTSPFTQTQQTFPWPGGDFWDATVTLPPLTRQQAGAWEGFLGELRGRANVFQLGDPRNKAPMGNARGTPVVATTTGTNMPMTTSLITRGWAVSTNRLLIPGDLFQVGYRLHRVCEVVNSDSGGNATITIWPSIRETPTDGTALVLKNPQGLFRLSINRRATHWSPQHLSSMSIQAIEAR